MILKTLISHQNNLNVAEVELELIPGLPQIHYLGLPDRLIKESFHRTKSALKNAGYQFPVSKQMIVNIKPNHLRKSSRGVELAVAIGLLILTEQIPSELIDANWIIYGELGLDGRVYQPSDLISKFQGQSDEIVLTGDLMDTVDSAAYEIRRLKKLNPFEWQMTRAASVFKTRRPDSGLEKFYSANESQLIKILSLTQAHALLAGPAGSGKSTLARSYASFLNEPVSTYDMDPDTEWHPVIETHSSITPAAFLGGGNQLFEGEISRLKKGILILDELLEYHSDILENLRGPMTGQTLRLSRGGHVQEISSKFSVLATTNFCPCGKWTPKNKLVSCRFSRLKCHKYLEKLSGPVADRFQILYFYDQEDAPSKRLFKGTEIYQEIVLARKNLESVEIKMPDWFKRNYDFLSARRLESLWAVARALTSLKKTEHVPLKQAISVAPEEVHQAEKWTVTPFSQLERGIS